MGPAVVLVHGLGVSADYWWRNGPEIAAAGYRVLAADLPGFGRTEGPLAGLSVEAQARALASWAEAMELGRAVHVGHSLGNAPYITLRAQAPRHSSALELAQRMQASDCALRPSRSAPTHE